MYIYIYIHSYADSRRLDELRTSENMMQESVPSDHLQVPPVPPADKKTAGFPTAATGGGFPHLDY